MVKKYITAILLLSFDMICMNAGIEITKEEVKEMFNADYKDFKKYISEMQTQILWTPDFLIKQGAKTMYKYDDVAVEYISASYPLFGLKKKEFKKTLDDLEYDINIEKMTILFNEGRRRSTDLNTLAHVTNEVGNRFKQKKIDETGQMPTQEETNRYVLGSIWVRYRLEKEYLKK